MIKRALSRLVFFFLYILSLLPFWVLYILSDGLYYVIYYILKYRRKVVEENLRNAFPQKTTEELEAIGKKYFRYLADLVVETIKLISISKAEILKRVKPKNPELIDRYFKGGKSIIGAVGHYCNWEMAAHRFSLLTDKKRVIVYKPLSNKAADAFYNRVRAKFGATLVPMRQTLRAFAESRNELTFTVLVADQTPVKHEAHYFTTFLKPADRSFFGDRKNCQND